MNLTFTIVLLFFVQIVQNFVNGNVSGEWKPYITEAEFKGIQGVPIAPVNISHNSLPVMSDGELSSHQTRPGFGSAIWTNARVPYILDDSLTSEHRRQVAIALQHYHNNTCIRFVPQQSSDRSWLRIQYDSRSNSNICGLAQLCMPSSGESFARFGGSCVTAGVIVHELGHSLCMAHEQSRQDRDNWITFDTRKCTADRKDGYTFGLNKLYDYLSVEHSEDKCYNGCIIPKESGVTTCGSGGTLSLLDVEILNEVYNCTSGCQGIRFANISTGLDQAFVTGMDEDGSALFTCRTYHQGDIIPGKYKDTEKACYVAYGGREYKKIGNFIEILKNPNGAILTWIQSTSKIPSNAVKGGRSNERETLYIVKCRLNIDGNIFETPGKYQDKAYASFGGVEYDCEDDFYFLGCK